jgi:hypothetical protein
MKTSKFFAAVLLSGVLSVSSVFATEGDKSSSISSNANDILREQIVSALSDVPAVDQEILIRFAVSEKKGFELLKVEGANAELVNTVKSELSSAPISVPSQLTGVYSLKVRFTENEAKEKVSTTDVLRSQIAGALSNVNVPESSSVKLVFSVANNSIKLNKVEGQNANVVSSVESALANANIVPPADLAGYYAVVVKF